MTTPAGLTLERHRDLEGRARQVWYRRGLILVLVAIVALALANFFGQHPATSHAESRAASLELQAPTRVRGGLMFQGRFDITARREIRHAVLVLDPGWAESMTINTLEPAPSEESSDNGKLAFDLGDIKAGDRFVFFMQFQVNPTNVGHRNANVALFDGGNQLVSLHRTITMFP